MRNAASLSRRGFLENNVDVHVHAGAIHPVIHSTSIIKTEIFSNIAPKELTSGDDHLTFHSLWQLARSGRDWGSGRITRNSHRKRRIKIKRVRLDILYDIPPDQHLLTNQRKLNEMLFFSDASNAEIESRFRAHNNIKAKLKNRWSPYKLDASRCKFSWMRHLSMKWMVRVLRTSPRDAHDVDDAPPLKRSRTRNSFSKTDVDVCRGNCIFSIKF